MYAALTTNTSVDRTIAGAIHHATFTGSLSGFARSAFQRRLDIIGRVKSESTARMQHRIDQFRLEPHPEGGWYREIYRAAHCVPPTHLPGDYPGERALATLIYFLLPAGIRTAWHRVRSEEFWLFIEGDPVHITAGREREGAPDLDVALTAAGTREALVPAGWWQRARADHDGSVGYGLVACLVAPGFDFEDFTLAK